MIPAVKEVMQRNADGSTNAVSISLIKGGIDIDMKSGGMELCSDLITRELGTPCAVLMGANVANEVAAGQFCEATIGVKGFGEAAASTATGNNLKNLFDLKP